MVRAPESEIVLKVVPRPDVPREKQLVPLERPFLRTADRFTVANLRQYLCMKFPGIASDNVRAEGATDILFFSAFCGSEAWPAGDSDCRPD